MRGPIVASEPPALAPLPPSASQVDRFIGWLNAHPEVDAVSVAHVEDEAFMQRKPGVTTRVRVSRGATSTLCAVRESQHACTQVATARHLWTLAFDERKERARLVVAFGPVAGETPDSAAHAAGYEFRFPGRSIHARGPIKLDESWIDEIQPSWFHAFAFAYPYTKVAWGELPPLELVEGPEWLHATADFEVSILGGDRLMNIESDTTEHICRRDTRWRCVELPRATVEDVHPDVCAGSLRRTPDTTQQGPYATNVRAHRDPSGSLTLFVEREWRRVCTPHTPSDTKTGIMLEAWSWPESGPLRRTGIAEIGYGRTHKLHYEGQGFVSVRPVSATCVDLVFQRKGRLLEWEKSQFTQFAVPEGRYCIDAQGRFTM